MTCTLSLSPLRPSKTVWQLSLPTLLSTSVKISFHSFSKHSWNFFFRSRERLMWFQSWNQNNSIRWLFGCFGSCTGRLGKCYSASNVFVSFSVQLVFLRVLNPSWCLRVRLWPFVLYCMYLWVCILNCLKSTLVFAILLNVCVTLLG